jgi:hypothetical protein
MTVDTRYDLLGNRRFTLDHHRAFYVLHAKLNLPLVGQTLDRFLGSNNQLN